MEFLGNSTPNTKVSVTVPLEPNTPSSKPLSPHQILVLHTPPPPPPPLATITSPPPPIKTDFVDDYFKQLPPGYRFCSFDGELCITLPWNKIVDVTLYEHNPEYLAEIYERHGDEEMYLSTPRNRKYRNGSRAADGGYWKATGKDKPVKYRGTLVGYRKTLDFYTGKALQGEKTNWKMHEFTVNDPAPNHQVRNTRDYMRVLD